jgi:hypothetical protein
MKPERTNWYAEIAVAALIVVLIVLCVFLVRQYQNAARRGAISAERTQFAEFVRHHRLGQTDANLIATWMTFDYVSVTFKVPTAYLMTALDIPSSTPGYPNITLGHYARTVATSSEAVVNEVQNAVKSYVVPASQ